RILNNLGNLVQADSQRRTEAETLYRELLTIHRELAKANPALYLPDVAMTLNNLGLLVAADSQRRKEAETLYREALSSYRELAKANPAMYLPNVATTLNNLGILVQADSQRHKEAETLYREALSSYRELAKGNPAVYQPDVANTLGAFGMAYLNWNEPAQALLLLQESAQLFAPLAQQAPGVFGEKHDFLLQLIEQAKAAKR
ncbi:MAG: tetratricopeptide repeat protein, partial [Thiothrix litoralis]|uniref:tetratricopeptide repeat protein n=1 Tax=Thiothrix litoralis TaxID=2891210 RepID=UPI003C71ED26